jgi:hypothetical protein
MVCPPRCHRRRHCRRCTATVTALLLCCLHCSASAAAAILLCCRHLPCSAANFVVMPPPPPPFRRLRATVPAPLPRWCCRSAAAHNTPLLTPLLCLRCHRAAAANITLLLLRCRLYPALVSALLPPPLCRHRRCRAAAAASALL